MRGRSRARSALARGACAALVCALAGALAGCVSTQRYKTNTKRAATEQLLLSIAADKALGDLGWPELEGKAVAVETAAIADQGAAYLKAAAEVQARSRGARVVARDEADWILLLLAGALGTEGSEFAIGIPEIPTPFGVVPAISFFEFERQRGLARLRLAAFDRSGAGVHESAGVLRGTYRSIYRVLFLQLQRGDIYRER